MRIRSKTQSPLLTFHMLHSDCKYCVHTPIIHIYGCKLRQLLSPHLVHYMSIYFGLFHREAMPKFCADIMSDMCKYQTLCIYHLYNCMKILCVVGVPIPFSVYVIVLGKNAKKDYYENSLRVKIRTFEMGK